MTQPALCRIDDITVDLTRRRVVRGRNEVISLSALSFDTLRALIEAAPLTANELIELAWQGSVVSDDTVISEFACFVKHSAMLSRSPSA